MSLGADALGTAGPRDHVDRIQVGEQCLAVHKRGEGPVTLLIHGFRDAAFVWADLMEVLGRRGAVVAPDLRGHGDSDWDAEARYRFPDYLDDIEKLIDKLGLDDMVVVGHSLGARIAIALAARRPGLVRALVVVDLSPLPPGPAVERMGAVSTEGYDSPDAYLRELAETRPILSETARLRLAAAALRRGPSGRYRLKFDPAVTAAHVRQPPAPLVRLDDAVDVSCPTLVIRGAWSALLSAPAAAELAERFSDGRLVTIPRSGHAVMMDNPAAFVDAVEDFIDTTRKWGAFP